MRGIVVVACALLAACEPFPQAEEGWGHGDAREAFEQWRALVVEGRMSDCVQLMSMSYKSQWLFDLLTNGNFTAAQWRVKLTGPARTDLDLWFPEAGKDTSRGRVLTLPRTVLADPSLNPLFASLLAVEKTDIADQFRRLEVIKASADENGVTLLIHNRHGDPELYQMVIEGGGWKVDGHHLRGR